MSASNRFDVSRAMHEALLAFRSGRLADAARLCESVLRADPRQADAANLAGAIALQSGNLAAALEWFDRALAIDNRFPEGFVNRGVALQRLGRFGEALESYARASAIAPGHLDALYNEGLALGALGRWSEALACYDRVLEREPRHLPAWNNSGNVLRKLRRPADALERYRRALGLDPGHAEALNNLGAALNDLDRYDEALVALDSALRSRPAYAEALNNRGVALRALDRRDGALADFARALEIDPGNIEALTNRGLALQESKRWDHAQSSFEQAIALRADYAEAHWNLALLCLARGDLESGWEHFEWRWKTDPFAPYVRQFAQPLWLGRESIAGKTILVHAEQGLGDTIQFSRYVPIVESQGARVVLESPRWLAILLASLSPSIEIVTKGSALPPFDVHCPLASLPLALWSSMPTIPSTFPYLRAEPTLRDEWQRRLGTKTRPRVGLAWSGNPKNRIDRSRSIDFARLAPLLHPHLEFHALQKEIRSADRDALDAHGAIRLWCDELRDFADTAALVEALDLVISVDSVVAHLAGALGKRTWAMLPAITDYRWPDRETSPWYPATRLFRQHSAGEWGSVIESVAAALGETFAPGSGPAT